MSIFGGITIIVILVIIAVLLRQRRTNKKRRQENLNPEKTAMVVQRSTKSKVFIIILNSLLLIVFLPSVWCYLGMSQLAANGGDPLGLMFLYIVSVPSLLVLALVLTCFKNRLQIPLVNILIPIVGIPALFIPLVVNGATPSGQGVIQHNYWTRVGLTGVGVGVALIIITVVITEVILFPKKSESEFNLSDKP